MKELNIRNNIKLVADIVETHSSLSLIKTEINLVSNELKCAIHPSKNVLNDIVACAESYVQYLPETSRGFIREKVKN